MSHRLVSILESQLKRCGPEQLAAPPEANQCGWPWRGFLLAFLVGAAAGCWLTLRWRLAELGSSAWASGTAAAAARGLPGAEPEAPSANASQVVTPSRLRAR